MISELQFVGFGRKQEASDAIVEDIMRRLDVERLLDFGIGSADEMEKDHSGEQGSQKDIYTST